MDGYEKARYHIGLITRNVSPRSTRRDATFLANLCQIRYDCIAMTVFFLFIDTESIVIRCDASPRQIRRVDTIVLFYSFERAILSFYFLLNPDRNGCSGWVFPKSDWIAVRTSRGKAEC